MAVNMTNLLGKVQMGVFGLILLWRPVEAQTIGSMVDAVSDSALFTTIAGLQAFGTQYFLARNATQVAKWVQERFPSIGLTDAVLDVFIYYDVQHRNTLWEGSGNRAQGSEG